MADTRSQIIEEARPLLNRGEVVAHVVRALEGPNRWLALLFAMFIGFTLSLLVGSPILALPFMWLGYTLLYKRRIILATDQSVLILGGARLRFSPKAVLDRLDVDTRIGPLKGVFLATTLNGRRMYVVPRCVREVTAADADLDV